MIKVIIVLLLLTAIGTSAIFGDESHETASAVFMSHHNALHKF